MQNDPSHTESDDYDLLAARALVAEAFHTFGEGAARSLAGMLGVDFDGCREIIERLEHRLQ